MIDLTGYLIVGASAAVATAGATKGVEILAHKKGGLAGHWAVWVDGNWRLTFAFEGEDAVLVDYQDYH